MIIEGIITTENADGSLHLSPIGPHVDAELTQWVLKPFKTSTTYANLRQSHRGVFHVVDNALLMSAAVLGLGNRASEEEWFSSLPLPLQDRIRYLRRGAYEEGTGWILNSAIRAFPLTILRWDDTEDRASAFCAKPVPRDIQPFWGWNRAKHSLLELAVLVSRRHLVPLQELEVGFAYHKTIIAKTAGEEELAALELLSMAMSR